MSPAELLARLTGLAVAAAGAVLAWGGLLAPTAGAPGADLLSLGAVATSPALVGAVGVAFVLAGLAVLLSRGRWLAVSVGGVVLVAVVALLAVGAASTRSVLGVGVVAVATLLAGASIERRPA